MTMTATTTMGDRNSDRKRASTASKELILNHDSARAQEEDDAGSGSRSGSGNENGNHPLAIRVTREYTLEREAGSRRLQ